jgi:hypothetical protein
MPDWLSQEATIVALAAAIVPVILTWVVEWLRARRRRRTVRRALLVEVRRIREELGGGGTGVLLDETDGSIWSALHVHEVEQVDRPTLPGREGCHLIA